MPQKIDSLSLPVPEALLGDGFIREAGLVPDLLPLSKATLWRMVKRKEFPAPVKLSRGVTAWRVPEVRAWLQACTNNRQ